MQAKYYSIANIIITCCNSNVYDKNVFGEVNTELYRHGY